MVSNSKIKWTIDAEKSEIFFKQKCLVLECCNGEKQNTHNEELLDNRSWYSWFFNETTEPETTGNFDTSTECMKIKSVEYFKKVNYNLVVFEEKNSKQFWKRNTFAGLLILNDYNLNVLIMLHKKRYDFDSNGAASATYFVKGELNKNDLNPDLEKPEENDTMVLNSVLLFEGEIKLVQDK